MKTSQYLSFFVLLGSFFACTEEEHSPIMEGTIPGMITEFTVENLPGGAEISYAISDEHVTYVLAEYQTREGGEIQHTQSSKYKNSVVVEGYPDTGEYEVKLYAVGRGEERSEPVTVTIQPTTPPVALAYESLVVSPDFGGVHIFGENPGKGDLAYEVLLRDDDVNWVVAERYFTSMERVDFSVRDMEAVSQEVGIVVRDRWMNYSDTLITELKPLNEFMIDMSNFYETNLPGDETEMVGTRRMSYLFDGRKLSHTRAYYTTAGSGMPQHFTIFLQGTYKLSRIMNWQNVTNSTIAYNSSNPKRFRVWGSMDPNPDGSFDESWYLLAEFENIKPSGLPQGTNTDEDNTRANEGDEYIFDRDIPPVRYIRIETQEVWGNTGRVYYTELEIYGDDAD